MNLFVSELRKLRTVPTTWIVTGLGWALVLLLVLLPMLLPDFGGEFTGSAGQVAGAIDAIGANSFIVLIVGVLVVTTEFRHGTIGRTLQLVPSRMKVLSAKLAGGVAYSVLFGVTSLVLVAVVLFMRAFAADVSLSWGSVAWTALWQVFVALGLTALLGVAVGALLRSQVLAITLSLIWVFVGEPMFSGFFPRVARWLPFTALDAVFVTEEMRAQGPQNLEYLEPGLALGVFLVYVVVFTAAAASLMRERDV